ncbi:MAG: hypothetical protein K9N23_22165 [Akkermansiaceae bacterium]|nr:hypothetical protein [Akkermansiaceae bacterium]MCF7734404.1 hypothetical protein [Akkermansiaceae bacterium]
MAQLLPVTAFSLDFSPQPAEKLDTVRVPLVGAPSASSDFRNGYLRFTDTRANKIFVTIECLYGFVAAKTHAPHQKGEVKIPNSASIWNFCFQNSMFALSCGHGSAHYRRLPYGLHSRRGLQGVRSKAPAS